MSVAAGPILAIDTATRTAVVALATAGGEPLGERRWQAGYRHGETLIPTIDELLRELAVDRRDLGAIVVGTGPGAFTGLRVGIATAKALAHALDRPIVGISTGEALLVGAAAGRERLALLLPAGPSDRVIVRAGEQPRLLSGGSEPDARPGERLVAVDLEGRAPAEALEIGEAAVGGLGSALLTLGRERLDAGDIDDLAALVPEYVTLPRGVVALDGEMAWSPAHR